MATYGEAKMQAPAKAGKAAAPKKKAAMPPKKGDTLSQGFTSMGSAKKSGGAKRGY